MAGEARDEGGTRRYAVSPAEVRAVVTEVLAELGRAGPGVPDARPRDFPADRQVRDTDTGHHAADRQVRDRGAGPGSGHHAADRQVRDAEATPAAPATTPAAAALAGDGAAAPRPPAGPPGIPTPRPTGPRRSAGADVDLPDPTAPERRRPIGVTDPVNPTGLENLVASTTARIGVGRAGPRPRTASLLLFRADHAVTQDAIFGEVPQALLDELGMFSVQTRVTGSEEYLLRPDLGRRLSDEGRAEVDRRCVKNPQVQIVVGDGLSWAAVANNLPKIYPVLESGLRGAGLTLGTPFFVRYCRVGVMNDVGDVTGADVVVLLIGERPGLGVADALSVYSGWRPRAGKTDAHRDVVCMITENGGTNPLEAGAFVVEHVRTVLAQQASGVELRLARGGGA
jgi:ethanolamine ammonia-lyase small subunit